MAHKICGGLNLLWIMSLLASCCIKGSLGGIAVNGVVCTQTSDCLTDSRLECLPATNRPPGCNVKQCMCPAGSMVEPTGSLLQPTTHCVQVTTIGAACTMADNKCPPMSNCTAEGSNYVCRCMPDYRPTLNNQICIPDVLCSGECGYMSGNCTSDSQCRTGLRCLNNNCVCNAGSEYFEYAGFGTCIPTSTQCTVTGTVCPSSRNIFSDIGDNLFDLKCHNGTCMCPTNYVQDQTTKFCLPMKDYACTADTDCVGTMTCQSSKCACPSGKAFTYYHPDVCVADGLMATTETDMCTLLPTAISLDKYCGVNKICVPCGQSGLDNRRCVSMPPPPGNGARPYTLSCLVTIFAAAGALLFQY